MHLTRGKQCEKFSERISRRTWQALSALAVLVACAMQSSQAHGQDRPDTTITSPHQGDRVDVGERVRVTGTALGDDRIRRVYVTVREARSGDWLHPDGSWGSRESNLADVDAPRNGTAAWRFSFRTHQNSEYVIEARARDREGDTDRRSARVAIVARAEATRTPTRRPEATNTRRPESTNTRRPEVTNTRRPEPTNTRGPEATNTRRPEVTNTRRPEPTNTRGPEATNTRRTEPTNTRRPEATNTRPPESTQTYTPTEPPPPTATPPEPTATATEPDPTETQTPLPPTDTPTPLPPTETATATATSTPEVEPPVAEFMGDNLSGFVPLAVNFTDLSSGTIDSWFWEFGDGDTSTEQHPTHAYGTPDVYTVTLTVTGPGGSDSETKVDYIEVFFGGGLG